MPDPARLSLSREEMRALGYQVVDMLVDHFATLPDRSVPHVSRRTETERRLREPVPERGMPAADVLQQVRRDVFDHVSHVDHPRFFAFIPSPGNFVGAMADALASGFNVFAGTWIESSGPSTVELVTIDWLRTLCGLPGGAGGLFVSGGSMANLTALAVARHARLDDHVDGAVVYASDQTHASLDRALWTLGFEPSQLRRLPSDDRFRLDVDALRRAVAADRAAGRTPFCVIANAGTTNTGAVDPLEDLAACCQEEHLWLHVDGAYGAAAVISEQGKTALRGLEHADSLVLDPHKWFFQPYEIGCVLVRDRRVMKDAFHILPAYMQDTLRPEEEEVNFSDYGLQLTRSFRALKLWMSLKVFGLAAFRRAVDHGIQLAETAERLLATMDGWTIVTPAELGIVAFRYAPDERSLSSANDLNRQIVAALERDGYAMISSTVLRGRTVLRLCTINPRTTEDDVRETLDRLDDIAQRLPSG